MPARLTRTPGWPARLTQAIEAARHRPFEWGQHDCGLFAATCIQAITGADLGIEVRGRYRSMAEAVVVMLRFWGVTDMEGAATHLLGEPIPLAFARRGDVVLLNVTSADGPALGICVGETAAAAGPTGLAFIASAHWLKAWKV